MLDVNADAARRYEAARSYGQSRPGNAFPGNAPVEIPAPTRKMMRLAAAAMRGDEKYTERREQCRLTPGLVEWLAPDLCRP